MEVKVKSREVRPHEGPQEAFLATDADVAIYGGSAGGGKSYALLMDPLRFRAFPRFRAAILRRTYPEITQPGGLWDVSTELYGGAGGIASPGRCEWRFAPDATISFRHCQYDKDLTSWHGSQVDALYFDELQYFTRKQFFYLLSRNRGSSGVTAYCRATCNPDADSWVAEFIAWWIDQETGYPIPERAGVKRYFVMLSDVIHWADTPEELIAEFGGDGIEILPKSMTFIPAKLDDNPTLVEANPGYRASLLAQRTVEQERLLYGNWKIGDDEGSEWPAEYFGDIYGGKWPDAFELSTIAIDPSKGRTESADPSAIVFVGLHRGTLYVDADIRRRPPPQIVVDAVNMAAEYQPNDIGVESNGFQELLITDFDDYIAENRGMIWPVHGVENYSVSKHTRIRRLGGWLRSGKIKLRRGSEGCKILVSQLRGFPNPKVHDDGPDALEMGIRNLNDLARALMANAEPEEVYQP